jgi:hypothetical protein
MRLAQLLRNAPSFSTLRETYSVRSEEDITLIVNVILSRLQPAVDEYVNEQDYPKYSVELFKPRQLVRMPEHIRAAIIDMVDEQLEDSEVLLKFDMYMTLCTIAGDTIQEMYASRYRKLMDSMNKKSPIPNIKNN